MTSILEIRSLYKAFKRPKQFVEFLQPWKSPTVVPALVDVSLRVDEGELVALVGPNGAGKTTLLETIADLIVPDAGDVYIRGQPLSKGQQDAVGYVLADERSFWLRLNVQDNLRFFAALEGLKHRDANERIWELAAQLGLTHLLDRRFAQLSRGQKQRVSIARGLLADPPILLFDEATRALDPGRAGRFRRLIREQLVERRNKTVLFATHQMDEAEVLSDRVALMLDGRIVKTGPWDDVKEAAEIAFKDEADAEDRALIELLDQARQ